MTTIIVVGAQWGDEGKGKVVDLLAEKADMVVRFAGGANAGHTLVTGGTKLVTHLIPSGVLHKGTACVLGDGMVVDPFTLIEEIDDCKKLGLLAQGELLIGDGAHVVMPYHKWIETAREQGSHKIGTTGRGIGPAYEAKAARKGIRVADLRSRKLVEELVERNLAEILPLLTHYGQEVPAPSAVTKMVDDLMVAADKLLPFVGAAGPAVATAIEAQKNVLLEGAQGALLDLDHGTYPYVTSSSTIAPGACQSLGLGPTRIDKVVGITKAYCTRVGEGPFPTEMKEDVAAGWREAGGEYGATTGRPRRCGWLDVPALRLAARINGLSSLALTKLDVLSGRGSIKVCTSYKVNGSETLELPQNLEALRNATPVFREFQGWSESITEARKLEDLPSAARSYISELETLIDVPLDFISVGPERTETLSLGTSFA